MVEEGCGRLRQLLECAGGVPDPTWGPLLEVVRQPCRKCRGTGGVAGGRAYGDPQDQMICPLCDGSGYRTRSWKGLPTGALSGALIWALWEVGWREAAYHSVGTPTHKALKDARRRVEKFLCSSWFLLDDTDVLDAVIAALGKRAKAILYPEKEVSNG